MADIGITNLNEFIALGKDPGFARSDRFQVNFTARPAGSSDGMIYLSLLCEEASFPGLFINTRSLRINALSEQRAHTIDYMGDSITMTFLVDNTWYVREAFEAWMELCIAQGDSNSAGSREVGYYNDYTSTLEMVSLAPARTSDDQIGDAATYQITMYEIWPKAISSQQFSNQAQNLMRLTVTFAFKWWVSEAITPSPNVPPVYQPLESASAPTKFGDDREPGVPGGQPESPSPSLLRIFSTVKQVLSSKNPRDLINNIRNINL